MANKKGVFKLLSFILAICIIIVSLPTISMAAYSFNLDEVKKCMNAYLAKHYKGGDINGLHFWEAAYCRQMLVDYYNLTGSEEDKNRILETWYWFEDDHAINRFGNEYCWISSDSDWTDDYSWHAQFSMSAYEATKDPHILEQAKWHFDYLYSNNVDDVWGGGMWRERHVRDQKDVPTNGFGIVAAQLAKYYPEEKIHNNLTGTDKTYLEIADDIYQWIKKSFMREDGGIENSFSTEGRGWDDNLYTYNAGIFIEMAAHLYDLTKDESYLADARKAADFAKEHFTRGIDQIVVYEDDVGGAGLYQPHPANSYEIVFRGILMRGIYKLITLGKQTQYIDWLTTNAQAAYKNRADNNLIAPYWDTPYDGSNVRPTANATGLTLMIYSLMVTQPGYLSGKVEAESAIKYGTAYKQKADAASGGYMAGSIDHVGSAIEFVNCIESTGLTISFTSGLSNPKLSFYINGEYKQKLEFEYTGSWSSNFREKTFDVDIPAGATVKIQYDDGDVPANIDYIKFISNVAADKSLLAEAVNNALLLNPKDYTPESWALLKSAIDTSRVIYNKANATQSEVDAAAIVLQTAINNLERRKLTGKVEAETGITYGDARKAGDSFQSGGALIYGMSDSKGSAVEFVNCAKASKLVIFAASAAENPKLALYINGEFVKDIDLISTGRWNGEDACAQVTVDVDIPDGATIKLQNDYGRDLGANVDYIGLTDFDNSELAKLISDSYSLIQMDYTKSTWDAFKAEFISALETNANCPSQQEINEAAARLKSAIEGLERISRNHSGKIEGEYGKKYGSAYSQSDSAASGRYKVGSIDHLGAAVEFKNLAATNKLIIVYATGLSDSHLSLYVNGEHNQDVYFPITGGWGAPFKEITIDVDIPEGGTIKFQYDNGDRAANIDYIIIPANKTELEAKIDEAKKLEKEKYTEESWALLETALNTANSVRENIGASQEEVDSALEELNAAIAGLKVPADKTELEAKIDEAKKLEKEKYTEESWSLLETALSKAVSVMEDVDASQEEVDSALEELKTAIAGLKVKTKPPVIIPPIVTPPVETPTEEEPATVPEATVVSSETSVISTTTVEAESDESGKATANVTEEQLSDAINKAVTEAAKEEGKAAMVEIAVSAATDAKSVEITIPAASIKAMNDSGINAITLATPFATITFDDEALIKIFKEAKNDVKITIDKADVSELPEEVREIVGNRPVYSFSVKADNKAISEFGDGKATVVIPYTLKPGEDKNAVVVYYINEEGKAEIVTNGSYNAETGNISFETDHFSRYAIGYNKVEFNDVAANAWYSNAVSFVAARGITLGTGNNNFSPNDKLTRGQFLVMLMRAYGIKPDENITDNFSDAGNTYYTGYLAAAKRLGISAGIGNNMFAPEKQITRQEMFTLLYNTLKLIDELPAKDTGRDLATFVDAGVIASWAKDAVEALVKAGIVSGNNNMLTPAGTANRAEMAQILYNLLSK
ncbi:MAG TPA: hypothetical protein GXX36_15045 [Clostridiaceae bacterium]|nr:hypothetical protein [Clostridiaceae bacterium]